MRSYAETGEAARPAVPSTDLLGDLEAKLCAHQKREVALREQMGIERQKILSTQREIAKVKHGIEIGSVVKYRGVLHRVTSVTEGYGKPWAEGNPMRKDGSYGTARRNLFSDWELVS